MNSFLREALPYRWFWLQSPYQVPLSPTSMSNPPPSKLLPKSPLASLQDTRGITRRSTRTIDDGYEDQDLRVRLACRAASASARSGPGGASASSESMSEYLSESNRVSRSIQRPLENQQTLNTELLVGTHRTAPSCGTAGAKSGVRPPQAGAWRGIRLITSGRLPPFFFEPLAINGWGQILRAKVRLSRVDPMHALDLTNSQERSRTCVPRGACPAC